MRQTSGTSVPQSADVSHDVLSGKSHIERREAGEKEGPGRGRNWEDV